MAAIYTTSVGTFGLFFRTFLDEQNAINGTGPVKIPSNFSVSLQIDETTNAALVADIQANPSHYTVVSGTLKKDGATVTVAAASALFSLYATALQGVPESTFQTIIAALWTGTATAAQQQKAIAYLAIKLRIAGLV